MSCIWVSAQECSRNELFQLTELVRKDRDLQIILSCEPPASGGKHEVTQERITDLLVRLGVRANLKGFLYLKTGVRRCMNDREEMDGITKRLYPAIAGKHQTSVARVEHAIRHAIETAWMKGNTQEQKLVFGYDASEGRRPTNAEFISRVADYVEKMNRPLFS